MSRTAESLLLTMDEAAAALGASRRWLQDFLKTMRDPCYLQVGRKKLFDEIAMTAIREAMRCHSNSLPQRKGARPITGSGARTSGITLTEALRLVKESSRQRRSKSGERKSNVVPMPRQTRLPSSQQP